MLGTKIRILQNNVARTSNAMHSCLDIANEQKIDLVLFQEPWMSRDNTYTISHSSFYCILPSMQDIRPRVAVFARRQSRFQPILRTDLGEDSDFLIIDVQDTQHQLESIQLVNIYNEKSLRENEETWTFTRFREKYIPQERTILCGDFNAHHTWWNSDANNSPQAMQIVEWLEHYSLNLLNEPDISTFFRSNLQFLSVLDLAFISPELENYAVQWEITEEKSGSDHEIIQIIIELDQENSVENPLYSNQYNLKKVNWEKINEELIQMSRSPEFLENEVLNSETLLETEARKLTSLIIKVINDNISKKRISEHSKPWWNDELRDKRKAMSKAQNLWKTGRAEYELFQQKRTEYFATIKTAKSDCWNQFLENAQGKEIFKAFQYTKQRRIEKLPLLIYENENHESINAASFEEKCQAFMTVLFKKPPASESFNWSECQNSERWEWPEVTETEIHEAIFTSSPSKAPGPDGISFQILQKMYPALKLRLIKIGRAHV